MPTPAVVEVRGDEFRVSKEGGFCEMTLKNATSGLVDAVLTNIGDGLTEFRAPAPGGVWGSITGDITDQTDLMTLLGTYNWDTVLSLGGSFTADRSADFSSHTLTFNNTLIFNKTSSWKFLQVSPIIPSEASQVNWNITRNTTAQPSFPGNEVVNFGFNVATNATPEVAGKPALFVSMESNYHPGGTRLMEWHEEFFNDAGSSWRVKSYTINHTGTSSPDIDIYFNGSRLYAKAISLPAYIPWSVGDFDSASVFQQFRTSGSAHSWQYGANANLYGNGSAGQFFVTGYAQYTLGSPTMLTCIQGAQTQIIAQNPATGTPLNLNDGAGHSAYFYNNGGHGQVQMTNAFLTNTLPTIFTVTTSSGNSVSYSSIGALSDTGNGTYLFNFGSAYSAASALVPVNSGAIYAGNPGGLSIYNNDASADIRFSPGVLLAPAITFYRNGSILVNTTVDLVTSILTLASTTKGFLPPRMTTTQKNAITSPAEGLVVYDLTTHKHYGYDGSAWQAMY